MGMERFCAKTPRMVARLSRSLLCIIGLSLSLSAPACDAFNLDVENPAVYSGAPGSYFGYAVDFYLADSASASVLIGAPKASTRQVNVTEGGSVFYCPWSLGQSDCHPIEFDTEALYTLEATGAFPLCSFCQQQTQIRRQRSTSLICCWPHVSWTSG